MRKEDLKTGMLVQFSSGELGLIVNDAIVKKDGYDLISELEDDLTSSFRPERWNIKKVSTVLSHRQLSVENWTLETLNDNLLWDREEATEMTIKEIEERLNISNLKIKK